MVTPLKMKSYSGVSPKNVPGVSMGIDGKKGSTPAKVMKGARSAGVMYKTPNVGALRGKNATDKSSGQSNPVKQSASDKGRYKPTPQPVQYSNATGPKGTKFVC